MTAEAELRSRILEAVQETSENLQRLGFIDKRKQRQLEALCLEPIPTYDAGQTRAPGERVNLSQNVLATPLDTSAPTDHSPD